MNLPDIRRLPFFFTIVFFFNPFIRRCGPFFYRDYIGTLSVRCEHQFCARTGFGLRAQHGIAEFFQSFLIRCKCLSLIQAISLSVKPCNHLHFRYIAAKLDLKAFLSVDQLDLCTVFHIQPDSICAVWPLVLSGRFPIQCTKLFLHRFCRHPGFCRSQTDQIKLFIRKIIAGFKELCHMKPIHRKLIFLNRAILRVPVYHR